MLQASKYRKSFITWFTVALNLGWVASIWIHRFLPLSDYPLWIHEGQILSQVLTHKAAPYYSLVHWPVPNATFMATTGVLDLFMNPEVSGKIFLSLVVTLYIWGSYRLISSMTSRRDSPLFLLPLLFVFHHSVWLGEISSSLGLGILFLAIAHVLVPGRPVYFWMICVLSLLIFFSHAVAYLCWLVFLTLNAVSQSSRFQRLKIFAAVSPSLFLMAIYVLHRGSPDGAGGFSAKSFGVSPLWQLHSLRATLHLSAEIGSIFSPLHFFSPFHLSDPRWLWWLAITFNLSVLTMVVILACWFCRMVIRPEDWRLFQSSSMRAAFLTPIGFFVIFLVVPFNATGIYGLNVRFLLPAFVLILAGLARTGLRRPLSERTQWTLTLVTASAATLVLGFQYLYVGRISQKLDGIYHILQQARLGPDFRVLASSEFEPDLPEPLPSREGIFPVRRPLVYFPEYLRTESRTPGPIFPTSIVRSSVSFRDLLTNIRAGTELPSAVVIVGLQKHNHETVGLLHDRYKTVVDTQNVLIVERK